MKNIYNKGKYRGHEYAKHLRPYLKKRGNRLWRRQAREAIKSEQEEVIVFPKSKKKQKKLKVKITTQGYKGSIHSYYTSFNSEKEMRDSIRRSCVIRTFILIK